MDIAKDKLLVSFSGGRTSGRMLRYCYDHLAAQYELITVFANTGKEHEGTLRFVDQCAKEWGIQIVWVEAAHKTSQGETFSTKGWKVSHRIVDFETASRNGEPFEEMLSVLGIPCSEAPFCSDQLKRKAIESYLRSIGWDDFYKAIGIRVDEIDRINPKFREKKIIYPLVNMEPTTKSGVIRWWNKQPFDLNIPAGFGNCDNCWKKSLRVLTHNAKADPTSFQWWQDMTDKYAHVREISNVEAISFYRGAMTIRDIFELTKLQDLQLDLFAEVNRYTGCGESCEVY